METDGWIPPGRTPRSAPPPTVVASAPPPPAPVASAPPAPPPAAAPAPPPATARLAPQVPTVSPLAIAPPPRALPDAIASAIDAEIPLPIARPRDIGTGASTQVAAVASAERPAERRAAPELVWQQGPSGQPLAGSGEADRPQVVADLPLPPRRPASNESIGSLVTAFASTSSGSSQDALSQLGIAPPTGLRGGVAPSENTAVVPAVLPPPILPPRRDIAAAPVAPVAAAVAAISTESQPRATASIAPRAPARNVIAIARDEGAALRSLFVDRVSVTPSSSTPARIAVARVRRDQPAPSGFVAAGGSGLAQGFSKEPRAAMSTSAFAGPAVAPLQLRP